MEMCVLFCCLGTTDRKETDCICASDIQIPEQQQLVTAAPTMYGLGFRHANTFWKTPVVYFYMHQTSSPNHVGAGCNHHFGVETFFCLRCCDTLFLAHWAVYHVESNSDAS
jgi:hypothetical protein